MACHLLQRVPEQDLENELARLWLASLADTIKKNWIGIQKKHDVPVNAIGMEIHPHDPAALKVWRSEGIDKFMKK